MIDSRPVRPLTSREIAAILGTMIGALAEGGMVSGDDHTAEIFEFIHWRLAFAEGRSTTSTFDVMSSPYLTVTACLINSLIAAHGDLTIEALRFWDAPSTQQEIDRLRRQAARHLHFPVVN